MRASRDSEAQPRIQKIRLPVTESKQLEFRRYARKLGNASASQRNKKASLGSAVGEVAGVHEKSTMLARDD